jgi:hypothetical protein
MSDDIDLLFSKLKKAQADKEIKKKTRPNSKNYKPYTYSSKADIPEEYWDEYLEEYRKENPNE